MQRCLRAANAPRAPGRLCTRTLWGTSSLVRGPGGMPALSCTSGGSSDPEEPSPQRDLGDLGPWWGGRGELAPSLTPSCQVQERPPPTRRQLCNSKHSPGIPAFQSSLLLRGAELLVSGRSLSALQDEEGTRGTCTSASNELHYGPVAPRHKRGGRGSSPPLMPEHHEPAGGAAGTRGETRAGWETSAPQALRGARPLLWGQGALPEGLGQGRGKSSQEREGPCELTHRGNCREAGRQLLLEERPCLTAKAAHAPAPRPGAHAGRPRDPQGTGRA